MNSLVKIFSIAVLVFITQAIQCMDIAIIKPDQELIEKLVSFHSPTKPCNLLAKPTLESYQKTGRHFIAKMHIFGVDRYYVVNTDDGVQKLVDTLRSGHVSSVEWFYYESNA